MIIIKSIILICVFITCFFIGKLISNKYVLRVKELNELNSALNIIESKIEFTYEPLPDIFQEVSRMFSKNIGNIFEKSSIYMKKLNAEESWSKSLENTDTNFTKEDIENIKNLGKMLGQTDKEGQINQLEVTKTLVQMQVNKALNEEEKNAKLYKTLGTVVGLAFVIILI